MLQVFPRSTSRRRLRAAATLLFLHTLSACSPESRESTLSPAGTLSAGADPATLRTAIETAIENATDLPQDLLEVEVEGGVVTIVGSVQCEECGGKFTPGNAGTIQQSLGAIVRAIPGVEGVNFELSTE